jgi:hypothetical protein
MVNEGGPPASLSDPEVEDRLRRLDGLLEKLEATPGATAETALQAVTALAEVYGSALARVADVLSETDGLLRQVAADELVGHLLTLHGLHPDSAAERVDRALREAADHLSRGTSAELAGIDDDVATIRVTASGCGASTVAAEVQEVVLGVAPELTGVETVTARPPALIPLEALHQRPGPAAAL